MPHGNSDFVTEDSVSVVRLSEPVVFGLMEDKNQKVGVTLVFNLALSSGKQHIAVLRKVIALFQDDVFIKKCQKNSVEEVASNIKAKLDS